MIYKLKDICFKITDGSHNPPTGIESSNYLMLSSKNIFDDLITFDSPRYLSEDDYILENKRTDIQNGDLLVTIVGTIGRVAVVKDIDINICLQRSVAVLKPNQDIVDSRYLMYQIQNMRPLLESEANGVAQKGIYLKQRQNIELQILDVDSQHKIVYVLDYLSRIIEYRKQQLSKLDELVKSRFIEMFGDYRINNKGFECKKGSELFKFSSGKFLPEEKRLESGIPVYGGNGIAWYTEEPLIDFSTIIIGRVGAQCGNIHAVTTPVWITDNAIYIKEQKARAYTLEFLAELMRMMDFYQYADFSGQPKITQKPLETLEYIMPPIELQKEYTAFIEHTDKLKCEVKESLDKLETLKKSLMQKYFG